MEELLELTDWLSIFLTVLNSTAISNIVAFLSAAISLVALRKTAKWRDKFKESAMSDAYKKATELWEALKSVENALKQLSPAYIGALDVTHNLPRASRYKENDVMRRTVRNTLKNAQQIRSSLIDRRIKIGYLRGEFKRLGYTASRSNNKRLDMLLDHVMHIESCIDSYVESAFDYFDDEEFCQGMRYTRLSLEPKDKTLSDLAEMIMGFKGEIYRRADIAGKLLIKTNYEVAISKLYTN
ncbi:hypothetical protein [Pseudomonas corrugata]|uniref:hypothetical protein n=2 Tax=Pseudomonas corrugata TaxID=47879 RepID=UPI001586ED69|nr:hypothetical protein [Pseudomonas corrugata]NUT66007.1 hypothetical protein [Pseudomonas corrugata]